MGISRLLGAAKLQSDPVADNPRYAAGRNFLANKHIIQIPLCRFIIIQCYLFIYLFIYLFYYTWNQLIKEFTQWILKWHSVCCWLIG